MKLVLLSYFDIGYSFGFTDSVFERKSVDNDKLYPGKDIETGLINPLGKAVSFDLDTDLGLLQPWLKFALHALEIETDLADYGIMSGEQSDRLKNIISKPPVEKADVYIFPMGVGLLHVELKDQIPPDLIKGFYHFMEFGAYAEFGVQLLHVVSQKMVHFEHKAYTTSHKNESPQRLFHIQTHGNYFRCIPQFLTSHTL